MLPEEPIAPWTDHIHPWQNVWRDRDHEFQPDRFDAFRNVLDAPAPGRHERFKEHCPAALRGGLSRIADPIRVVPAKARLNATSKAGHSPTFQKLLHDLVNN